MESAVQFDAVLHSVSNTFFCSEFIFHLMLYPRACRSYRASSHHIKVIQMNFAHTRSTENMNDTSKTDGATSI